MDNIKLKIGHYKDALEFTKDVLSCSSSIDEIAINANIQEETIDEMKERLEQTK